MAQKLDKQLAQSLEEFNKEVAASAERIIFTVFPAKILALNKLITDAAAPSSPFHPDSARDATDARVHPPPGPEPKKRRIEDDGAGDGARYPALVRANAHLALVHAVIKRECLELAESCDKCKLWINLSMPRIEDGDNFGVQVQEECLTELHRSQESSVNLRDAARQHHLTRAKIASKLIKYPHIEDYTIGLREHDEKVLHQARQNLNDLRNIYAVLFDILNKNIVKLRSPKGNNSSNMY